MAVLSPSLLFYIFPSKGVSELSFIDVIGYTVSVSTICMAIFYFLKYMGPKKTNKIMVLRNWNDNEDSVRVATELKKQGFEVDTQSIDYYFANITDSNNSNRKQHNTNIPTNSIIIIGKDSFESVYLHSVMKTMKDIGLNYVFLMTSKEVKIPNYIQKHKVIGVIDQLQDPQFKDNFINTLRML